MSVKVVARIRPLLKAEIEKDTIVDAWGESKTTVRIPNPKNEAELYSFQFGSVYDRDTTQAEFFDNEVAPTVKHLFKGYDVTLFAYGVTGTGKTHTMRGGKSMADRGAIPRLLSAIYRRARKIEKDAQANGEDTTVEVVMSYYEIYCDRVYDLFEPPEKRTPAGLSIRDNASGKAVVVGLSEKPCSTLKDFERMYDLANLNRSTSATKLNAHSSRSHAILCVKVIQTTGNQVRVSTASAIDLAGSEDNRRTDNNKERLVESASINKSLFVLASCVEAISKKQSRIPYRESKMTRILALGQNNGLTVMILNLAPVRSYHLDTLSSLNFANRTKKIEVNEIENQSFFRDMPVKGKLEGGIEKSAEVINLNRQPLRPKLLSQNSHLRDVGVATKPLKQFAVYTDKSRPAQPLIRASQSPKRKSGDASLSIVPRPTKLAKLGSAIHAGMSQDAIEALIDRKVSEALAGQKKSQQEIDVSLQPVISDEVQKRLDALERRVEGQETERAEGLQYLLMAKQHQARGEDTNALRMYQLALPHFPNNEKLMRKVAKLQSRLSSQHLPTAPASNSITSTRRRISDDEDASYHDILPTDHSNFIDHDDEYDFNPRAKTKSRKPPSATFDDLNPTPRTRNLLTIINSRDVAQIKLLKGVGAKKAEVIVNCLCEMGAENEIGSLGQLGALKGVGGRGVENMRLGLGEIEVEF